MFEILPLPGDYNFGAVVENIHTADIQSPEIRETLYNLWIDKGLLVFRGMEGGRQTQFQLSTIFGDLEIHPVEIARLPEQPEITMARYTPGEGGVCLVDGEERGAYLPWHSDLIYVEHINRGGLLRAVQLPSRGGQTGFIDQIQLYDALPEDIRECIDGLSVVYHYDMDKRKFGRPRNVVRKDVRPSPDPDRYCFVAHPMVFTQAETGRKVLNVSPWFAIGIEGMENEEGDALLARVIDHCEDERRAYYHRWRPDDMVLWDNWRMLHSSYGVPPDEARRVERTTLRGDYQLGRVIRRAPASERRRVSVMNPEG